MSCELSYENILIQARGFLNQNAIKLWEEPYSVNGASNDEEMKVKIKTVRNIQIPFIVLLFLRVWQLS